MIIPLDKITDNPKNPNRMIDGDYAKLVANIKRTGYYPPLIVRPIEAGHYMLIDGFHRRKALHALKKTDANCDVWNLSEKEADIALASLNTLRGSDDPRKRAELIDSLISTGFSADSLAHMISETPSEIEDYLKLMAVDADVIEAMERILEPDPPESAMKITFALFPGQYETVRRALDHLLDAHDLRGAKNADAQALEYMAADYNAGAAPHEEKPAA